MQIDEKKPRGAFHTHTCIHRPCTGRSQPARHRGLWNQDDLAGEVVLMKPGTEDSRYVKKEKNQKNSQAREGYATHQ